MTRLFLDRVAAIVFWIVGHVTLYLYLNLLIPYATMNLFFLVLWIAVTYFAHHKWSFFMACKTYSLFEF
jgi:hypothetical protein